MTPGRRLASCLVGAALLAAGVLAWTRWPLEATPPAPTTTGDDVAARGARLERLRRQIERERDQLLEARRQQDRTESELQALEQSLDDARERVGQLQQELEAAAEDAD